MLGEVFAGIVAVECPNRGFFAIFLWPLAPLSGKTRVECQKLRVFCDFVPEFVLRFVLTTCFATHGLFIQVSKNERKSSKIVKS